MVDFLISLAMLAELAVITVWLWQHVEMNRIRREGLRVVVEETASAGADSVTVIVPARNEAPRIAACVRSVLTQDHAPVRLTVVDDRSEDGTAEAVHEAVAGDDRVSIMRIDELPAGWLGKSYALWTAAQTARSEWLLFIDADCRLLPGGLRSALTYAVQRNVDFLTLWPRDGSVGFWDRLLVPLCGAMIVIWYGSRRVNDPNSPDAFANGQFILVRREPYLSLGGHRAVRSAIIEDVPLARRAKAAGLKVCSALGADVYTVRMYDSVGRIIRGWNRIYAGVLSRAQIAGCMLSLLIGSLLPFGILIATSVGLHQGRGGWWMTWWILGAAHLAALSATSVRFFSLARCRLHYLLLYPLSCLGVLGILLTAWVQSFGRRRVSWKGTQYEVVSGRIQP